MRNACTHRCLLVLLAAFGCASPTPDDVPSFGGEGGEHSPPSGGAGDSGGGGAGDTGGTAGGLQPGEGGTAGGGGQTMAVGTESDELPPTAAPFTEAPRFRSAFDDRDAFAKQFAVVEGGDAVAIEGGALRIAPGKAGTVLIDSTPGSAPGDVFTGDLTIQFRVKGDTTPLVPPIAVSPARAINEAWLVLPQGNRSSAPRISFRWSEAGEDSLSFRTGTDVTNHKAAGTRLGGLIFSTPAYSGDVWYTVRVSIKSSGNGQAVADARVFDGPILVFSAQQALTGLTASGEIAVGGAPGRGGRPSPLLIDDLEIWSKAAPARVDSDEYHRTSVGGSNVQLWIPPGLNRVNGIFLESPGAGGDTSPSTTRPWFQWFAEMHGYAIVGHGVGLDPAGMIRAFEQLATVSGHDELASVPIVMYGFSNGARQLTAMMNQFPKRLIAYVGDSCPITPNPSTDAMTIPGAFVFGETDTTGDDRIALFAVQRSTRNKGGRMAVLEKQGLAHTPMSTYFFFLPYLHKTLQVVQPDPSKPPVAVDDANGWLLEAEGWRAADLRTPAAMARIAATSDYPADKANTGWFASKDLAYLAAAYTGFNRALVVTPMQHAEEGDTRTIRVRHAPDMADWEKIEIYDYGTIVHTFRPGDRLLHRYEKLSRGVHSIAAHMTHAGKVYPSFPAMVIVKGKN